MTRDDPADRAAALFAADFSDYPELPAFLDRRLRAVPTTKTNSTGELQMSLEEAVAANTAAIKELTAVLQKGVTATVTKTADSAGGADDGAGKKSGKGGGKGADKEKQAPAIAYPEVGALITQLAKEKGRDAALEVLGTFNVKNGKDLKSADYPAAVEALKAALAAEDEELG